MRVFVAVFLLLAAAGGAYAYIQSEPDWYVRLRYPLEYDHIVTGHAENYDLDPALLAAVIYRESKFDANAKSSSGAIGLMQLLPDTAKGIALHTGGSQFEVSDLYDPEINVRYGSFYLRRLLNKYGNVRLALAAYNAGQAQRGRMAREGGGDRLPRDPAVRRRGAARARRLRRDVRGRARPRSARLSTASIETMAEFKVSEAYRPTGDQPQAIASLSKSIAAGDRYQTLLGATGTGKTAAMAWIIEQVQKPTLVIAHNKTLAAQLCNEFREFLPGNAVEYFVSYYDYYQPEAYVPQADLYIEKDASINDDIDRLRHAATAALLARRDVVIVASVSCIYGIGSPIEYEDKTVVLGVGMDIDRDVMLRKLVDIQYSRNDSFLGRGRFRVRGDVVEVQPAHMESAYRISLFGDEVEQITHFDPLSGEIYARLEHLAIFPATQYVTSKDTIERSVGEIRHELEEQVKLFESQGKLLEAHRIRQRTEYDLEMLQELGYCNGIENYSRILDGRAPGTRPEHTSRLLPRRLRGDGRRVAPDRPADRRHVRRRPLAQGDAGRLRLPAPFGARQPAAPLRRVPRKRAAARLRLGDARAVRARATRRTSPSRSSARPGSSTRRSSSGRRRTRSTTC